MENKPKNPTNPNNGEFIQALEILTADLSKRAQEIIFGRFGISAKKSLTLEEIGQKYGITRERVRQVIREVLKKVKDMKANPIAQRISEKTKFTLSENSGIMNEKSLLAALGNENEKEQGAARFFLECFEDLQYFEIKGEMHKAYALTDFNLQSWRQIKNTAKEVLKKEGQPMDAKDFFDKVATTQKSLDEKTFLDYLQVSEEIGKNSFGKWGLVEWKEVSPKGTREKAFLVLKEAGKPLHFKTIAQQIDKYQLNKKKTHPQTVHNELIKDSSFVLVGRGMYALAQWGYKKGTVKDVLIDILTKSQAPLTREQILEKVMEVRHVKKSTIIINLNNFFKKTEDGKYTLKK